VTELGVDLVAYVSHATQQRLQNLLEKVSQVAQHKNFIFKVGFRASRVGMGIENRYHYGTGSRTIDTNGIVSKRIFRYRIPVLEINCFTAPWWTKRNIACRRRHAPNVA